MCAVVKRVLKKTNKFYSHSLKVSTIENLWYVIIPYAFIFICQYIQVCNYVC